MPFTGYVVVTFPSLAEAVIKSTGTLSRCDYNSTTRTAKCSGVCANAGGCSGTSLKTLVLLDTYVRNMGWIKSPLDPTTDSIQILTTDADGYYIDRVNTSLFATLSLTTNVITLNTITRNDTLINQRINMNFSLTYQNNPVPSGGYIILGIPDDTIYKTEYTIQSYLGSASLSTTASYYTSNTNQI